MKYLAPGSYPIFLAMLGVVHKAVGGLALKKVDNTWYIWNHDGCVSWTNLATAQHSTVWKGQWKENWSSSHLIFPYWIQLAEWNIYQSDDCIKSCSLVESALCTLWR